MKRVIFVALVVLCSIAVFADDMAMMSSVVGPDGTVYVRKTIVDTSGGMMSSKTVTETVAISPAGVVKWHHTGSPVTHIAFSGDNVILLSTNGARTEVLALKADGFAIWANELDGAPTGIEVTSTQIYVTTFKAGMPLLHGRPSMPGPVMSAAPTVTALNPASGVVLWSVTP